MPSWTVRGPISWQNGLAAAQPPPEEARAVRLAVVPHPTHDAPSALLHPATATRLGLPLLGGLLGLADGSDCVVEARVDASIAEGELALTPVQQFNLHAAAATSAEFRMFTPPPEEQPFELAEVEVEVMAVRRAVAAAPTQQQAAAAAGAAEGAGVEVDAREVEQELRGQCWGRPLAANEVVAVRAGGGRQLLLRVAAAHKLDAAARAEAVGYHCYRGALTTDTAVYLTSPLAGGSEAAGGGAVLLPQSTVAARVPVKLLNAREPPQPGQSRRCVNVYTSDGEWFPVQRKLLRPCIALTKLVRSEEAAPTVHVGIDTLTFDRVLIFLEALVLGREPPHFGLHLLAALLDAARELGLRALEEHCQERLGKSEQERRLYSFAEIQALNAQGECWLILDGMILDVTRWLPEHPGGDTIIPAQALNLDCSRFFEVYHASRESFVYLIEFYRGELLPADMHLVPQPEEPPSQDFLQQLREYTAWRLPVERVYKSF